MIRQSTPWQTKSQTYPESAQNSFLQADPQGSQVLVVLVIVAELSSKGRNLVIREFRPSGRVQVGLHGFWRLKNEIMKSPPPCNPVDQVSRLSQLKLDGNTK